MAETMQKLNALGQAIEPHAKNSDRYGGGQIVNVTYGHHGSGKLYSYYGRNKRVGDIVTPEVTHPKSGKTYKTLAVVRSTHNAGKGKDTVDYLESKNIPLKYIGDADQKSLPGYYKGWDKDAKAAYELRHETLTRDDIPEMQKMSLLGEINKLRR